VYLDKGVIISRRHLIREDGEILATSTSIRLLISSGFRVPGGFHLPRDTYRVVVFIAGEVDKSISGTKVREDLT
jgi:hypothetical protein